MREDVFVYLRQLPDGIRSFATPCADGYTVYIDSRLDKEGQIRAYKHELAHISGSDFESHSDVQTIECRAIR